MYDMGKKYWIGENVGNMFNKHFRILVGIIIIILICVGSCFIDNYNKKETVFEYYNGDDAESIVESIINENGEIKTKKFFFVFRIGPTDGKTEYSYIIALSKNQWLYVLQGYQNMYDRLVEGKPLSFQTKTVLCRKIPYNDVKSIKNMLQKACDEYDKENIKKILDDYPPSWRYEALIYYNNKKYSYCPDIIGETLHSYNHMYAGKERFASFEIPNINIFHQYMLSIIDQSHTGVGSAYVCRIIQGDGSVYDSDSLYNL